jgi:hypothetical protein
MEIFVWQNISENSNDAMCHILRLPHYDQIIVCIVVASVVVGVVA